LLTTKLSEILGRHRINQTEFAEKSNLSNNTVNKVYNDNWLQMRRTTIIKICNALDITPCELFEFKKDDAQ